MGRVATLQPIKDQAKDLWYVSLPPRLSPTGKRKREYFRSLRDAEERATKARRELEQSVAIIRKAGPILIEVAVTYDELFQIYGFGGLKEACEKFASLLEVERKAVRFGELMAAFEEAHWEDWSKRTRTAWNWVKKHLRSLEEETRRYFRHRILEWLDQENCHQGRMGLGFLQ